MLEVKNLTAFYGPLKVLDNISFKIFDQEIVAFIGPNGSGKSTAAKAIFGFVDKIDGDIVFNDRQYQRYSSQRIGKSRDLISSGWKTNIFFYDCIR